jgi:hypothetical protein
VWIAVFSLDDALLVLRDEHEERRSSMRAPRLLVVEMLMLIVIGAVSGCGQLTSAAQRIVPASAQQTPLPAVHIDLEIDRCMYTIPKQLCDAPLVAEVVVGVHGEARWNTEDGKRSPIATGGEIVRQGYFIYAPVTFTSFTPLHAHELAHGVAYMTIGGQVGLDGYRYGDYPQLPVAGGHYILVITTPAPRKVIIQRAGDPNEPGTGPVQPEIAVALADLKATLARCAL